LVHYPSKYYYLFHLNYS